MRLKSDKLDPNLINEKKMGPIHKLKSDCLKMCIIYDIKVRFMRIK